MLALSSHVPLGRTRVSHGYDYVRVALPGGTVRLVHRHAAYCAVGLLGFEIDIAGVDYVLFRDTDTAFALVQAVQDLGPHAARVGALPPAVLAVDLVRLADHADATRGLSRGWSYTHFRTRARLAGEQEVEPVSGHDNNITT